MNENLIFDAAEPAWADTPYWGPAHLRADSPAPAPSALDLRDGAGERPEDN